MNRSVSEEELRTHKFGPFAMSQLFKRYDVTDAEEVLASFTGAKQTRLLGDVKPFMRGFIMAASLHAILFATDNDQNERFNEEETEALQTAVIAFLNYGRRAKQTGK